jgi:hypothetical protein
MSRDIITRDKIRNQKKQANYKRHKTEHKIERNKGMTDMTEDRQETKRTQAEHKIRNQKKHK